MQSITPLQTVFPANNGLAAQLKQIAQIIQVRAALGVQRQIFFAGIGNFDTHADQLALQSALLAQISPALAAFYNATVELNVASEVTTFTMSDFSRTFQPNSNNGSDHAWGAHHIVHGRRGERRPDLRHISDPGAGRAGRFGLERPLGSDDGQLAVCGDAGAVVWRERRRTAAVLPSIGNFTTNNLGFV